MRPFVDSNVEKLKMKVLDLVSANSGNPTVVVGGVVGAVVAVLLVVGAILSAVFFIRRR